MLGFNDTSTFVGHFMSSLRERDRRDTRRDEREEQGRKRKKNKSKKTEDINIFPLHLPATRKQALPNCEPISVGRPDDVRYTTSLHHPTTTRRNMKAICYIFQQSCTLFKT